MKPLQSSELPKPHEQQVVPGSSPGRVLGSGEWVVGSGEGTLWMEGGWGGGGSTSSVSSVLALSSGMPS